MLRTLEMFLQWIVYIINGYCTTNAQHCCSAVLERAANWSVNDEVILELTSFEFVDIASGYPRISNDSAIVKVVARVNKEHAESLCDDEIRGGRGRRADHEVYLNKTLLTDAIRHSLADLQQNLSITVLRVWSANDERLTTTTSSPTSPSSDVVLIAVIIGVLLGLILLIVVVALITWQCRKRRHAKRDARDFYPVPDIPMTRFSTTRDQQARAADSDNDGFTEVPLTSD